MSVATDWPWVAIVALGALHGLNPGMGWLFAAALGMQEGKGSAAWRALPPLALGHALAVAGALVAALALGLAVSPSVVKWTVGAILVGYGLFRLVRAGHPRWGGMRVGTRDLTIWSFLMATAHGAGLMVLPFFMAGGGSGNPKGEVVGGLEGMNHAAHLHGPLPGDVTAAAIGSPDLAGALAVVVLHTGAYLVVSGAIAVLVVSWLGLRLLRTLWIDLDRIWALALILTGALTTFL